MSQRIAESDKLWGQEETLYHWTLPPRAPFILRLPVIRWVRFVILQHMVYNRARGFGRIGIGLGTPNRYDEWVLWAIYRGWC